MPEIVRVQDKTEVRVLRCYAVSNFVQIGFADRDCPSRAQAFDYGGVVVRNKVLEYQRPGGGPDSARVEQILVGDGYAVQRPAIAPFRQLAVALVRFGESLLFGERDQAVELVAGFDVGASLPDQLGTGNFSAAQPRSQLADVHEVDSRGGAKRSSSAFS